MDGNLGYILAAYGLVWGALGLYTLRRWRRLGELARALEVEKRPDA